jgi:hypothetical protein
MEIPYAKRRDGNAWGDRVLDAAFCPDCAAGSLSLHARGNTDTDHRKREIMVDPHWMPERRGGGALRTRRATKADPGKAKNRICRTRDRAAPATPRPGPIGSAA